MGKTRNKIAVIAALSLIWPTFASSQQGGAGAPAGSATAPTTGTATTGATPTTSVVSAPASGTGAPTGGLQIDIGISSSLKADTNFQLKPGGSTGSSEINDNKLTFGISSVNSAYSLNVTGSGVLRFADIPGRSIRGFEDPTLKVNFVADSANSRLTLDGRYRNVNRDFLNPFQVEQEEQQFGLLVGDGGTLRNTVLGAKYETGLNDPLGFIFDLKHDDKQYANVVNPQIFDNRTDSASATALMRVSPVTTLRANAALKHYTADDTVQTDRTTTDYSVGVTQDINPVLLLDAQIGVTDVKTDTISGTANRSGVVSSLTLTQSLANGTIFGTIGDSINQNGTRTNLSFGRDLQLPNGSLRVAFGLTRGSTGSTKATGSLAYTHQLASSDITVSVNRSASTNNSNQDILDTRIAVGYGRDINNVSRIDLTLNWGRSEDAGSTGAPTIDLTNLNAAYTRALTSDWNMTGGLTLRQRTETGKADANSTALFLTLGRNFSFRP